MQGHIAAITLKFIDRLNPLYLANKLKRIKPDLIFNTSTSYIVAIGKAGVPAVIPTIAAITLKFIERFNPLYLAKNKTKEDEASSNFQYFHIPNSGSRKGRCSSSPFHHTFVAL